MSGRWILVPFALSVGALVICLALEGFSTGNTSWPGWGCLLFGWWALPTGCLAWLANPVLLLAWALHLVGRSSGAALTAIVSLVFMLTFLATDTVVANTGSVPDRVTHIGLGYWVWLFSAFAALVAAVQASVLSPATRDVPPIKDGT